MHKLFTRADPPSSPPSSPTAVHTEAAPTPVGIIAQARQQVLAAEAAMHTARRVVTEGRSLHGAAQAAATAGDLDTAAALLARAQAFDLVLPELERAARAAEFAHQQARERLAAELEYQRSLERQIAALDQQGEPWHAEIDRISAAHAALLAVITEARANDLINELRPFAVRLENARRRGASLAAARARLEAY